MKKLFCLLMALIMMLTLSACTFPWQKDETPDDDPPTDTDTPSDEEDTDSEVPPFVAPGTDTSDGPIVFPILPVK